jgi:hypothetical protein
VSEPARRRDRPFSTQKFRTDGRTIFLEITDNIREGELIDLRHRQGVFHSVILPSLHYLEFDAEIVARWFPLGSGLESQRRRDLRERPFSCNY